MPDFKLINFCLFDFIIYTNVVIFNVDQTRYSLYRQRVSVYGFTLIELIMVIVLLGVLAVFAAPRFFNGTDFNARGFHDETLAFLRYAQKTAVAQRRTVCVTFLAQIPAGAVLSIASVGASSTCDLSLIGPNKNCPNALGGSSGCINAKSGVSYSTVPVNISFNGLGRPVGAASTLTIQVATNGAPIAQVISVEPETGYVHD